LGIVRRRIFRAPRHNMLMPDSRAKYKPNTLCLCASAPLWLAMQREARVSAVLTR
jgi:hypothetical protein